MKELVRRDPAKPVGHAAWSIRIEAAKEYSDDEEFYQNLVIELGSDAALEKQLLRVRYEVIGETPRTRNEFNPESFLKGIFGEENGVVIGDSNELDKNWREEMNRTNPQSQYEWAKLNDALLEIEQSHIEELLE